MSTGGSRGIRISEDYVRRGAAAARTMLLQAAGEARKVPVSEFTASKKASSRTQLELRQGGRSHERTHATRSQKHHAAQPTRMEGCGPVDASP